ncbi:MAG: isoprenylcysteine carboxylmethyltransferase family protein [Methanobacteriota archaeon]|nr:MAG: isoprenylcysteine carboxylmethyltransferase family protein [Euryarchaeota archaeon]
MKSETKDNILMSTVAFVFFVNFLLLSNVILDTNPVMEELAILGWMLLFLGASPVTLSILSLRTHGTTSLNRNGIYAIVRHPMYVGGMVMFLSHICFGQHWAVTLSTVVGVCSCYLLIRSEERRLADTFGGDYSRYMREVPGVNFASGAIRFLRRPPDR